MNDLNNQFKNTIS